MKMRNGILIVAALAYLACAALLVRDADDAHNLRVMRQRNIERVSFYQSNLQFRNRCHEWIESNPKMKIWELEATSDRMDSLGYYQLTDDIPCWALTEKP